MVFLSLAIFATATAANIFLLITGLGGFAGIAALVKVFFDWRKDTAQQKVETKSVAITELEKAVPGLSDIIEQWQLVVHQLQIDLTACRDELKEVRDKQDGRA